MKKQILLLCLALTSLCSYAQTITVKGVVTSASDKEPMKETDQVFEGVADYLEQFDADERDMTKYVIGTISDR